MISKQALSCGKSEIFEILDSNVDFYADINDTRMYDRLSEYLKLCLKFLQNLGIKTEFRLRGHDRTATNCNLQIVAYNKAIFVKNDLKSCVNYFI